MMYTKGQQVECGGLLHIKLKSFMTWIQGLPEPIEITEEIDH